MRKFEQFLVFMCCNALQHLTHLAIPAFQCATMGDPELGEGTAEANRSQTPEDGLDPAIDMELNPHEKRFLLYAERGDVASVKQ